MTQAAKKLLDEFTGPLEAALQDTSEKDGTRWHDMLIAHIITREARALIGPP